MSYNGTQLLAGMNQDVIQNLIETVTHSLQDSSLDFYVLS